VVRFRGVVVRIATDTSAKAVTTMNRTLAPVVPWIPFLSNDLRGRFERGDGVLGWD
jgi:hypothetical protein